MIAVMSFPSYRCRVPELQPRQGQWGCEIWRIKLNASKTQTMIVSRSRIMHHQSPTLTIVEDSDDLDILGVTFDSKVTFDWHLHSISRAE